jgi:hypothetical protein
VLLPPAEVVFPPLAELELPPFAAPPVALAPPALLVPARPPVLCVPADPESELPPEPLWAWEPPEPCGAASGCVSPDGDEQAKKSTGSAKPKSCAESFIDNLREG